MILLNKDGRVLFGRRSNTGWQDGKLSLPSGHVDPGELPTESAIRELEEELILLLSLSKSKSSILLIEKTTTLTSISLLEIGLAIQS
jgi:8-oxo-dGTP pyrophosphatase MutT (NUDIX family)